MLVDLTAANSANYIDSENATVINISGNKLIVPKYAPFYSKDLVVSVLQINGTTVNLVKGTDYILAAKWHDVGLVNGGVYSAIFITNKLLSGQFFVRYRALGGNAVPDVSQFTEFFGIVSGKYDIASTQSLVNPSQELTISTLRDYLNVQSSYAALPLIAGYYLQTQTSSSGNVTSSGQNELQQISSTANQAIAIANNAARIASDAQADVNSKFEMPVGGIARTMLAQDVQTSLTRADNSTSGTSQVTSVNSQTGAVNLTATDISGLGTAALQQANSFATAAQGAKADTALQSVPQATAVQLGLVRVGSGIDLSPQGEISVTVSSINAATAAQGAKADSALQVAPVLSINGRTGSITLSTSDIGGLGSAASVSVEDFATAAQGTKADNAIQTVNGKSGNSVNINAADIGALNQTTADTLYATLVQGIAATSAVQSVNGHIGNAITLAASDIGAISLATADSRYASIAQGATAATAVQSVNGKTGTSVSLVASDISGLAASATTDTTNAFNITTGVFNKSLFPSLDTTDITGLGSAALQPAASFATSTQGAKADTAVQSVNGQTGEDLVLSAADVGALTLSAADIRYIRTINGLTPDANGNIEIAAGSGGPVTDYDGGTF